MYFVNLLQGQVLTFGGGKNFYYISLVKWKEKLIEMESAAYAHP